MGLSTHRLVAFILAINFLLALSIDIYENPRAIESTKMEAQIQMLEEEIQWAQTQEENPEPENQLTEPS